MADSAPIIIFGTSSIATFSTETAWDMLSVLQEHGVKDLDTARGYVYYLHLALH